MNAREELTERLTEHRAAILGSLSDGAREELNHAVSQNPAAFIDIPADNAFFQLVQALERYEHARTNLELIEDDDTFYTTRNTLLHTLETECKAVLKIDPTCLDAALIAILAADEPPAITLEALLELREHIATQTRENQGVQDYVQGGWSQVRARDRLRLDAAIARSYLETSHYRLAISSCTQLLTADPEDHLGARRTCALAYARLEDEAAFDALDQRFGRRGDSWLHIARILLHYKLGNLASARRALMGFSQLVVGGAYALLRPIIVDVYLPDRPNTAPFSYHEATLAVWEAEPIIVDAPDFSAWAASQPAVSTAAQTFAERNGLDW